MTNNKSLGVGWGHWLRQIIDVAELTNYFLIQKSEMDKRHM